MCGFAGFMNFKQHRAMAWSANALQKHRGPDAQNVWSGPELSLASQRLSIIDLNERSDQPMEKDGLVISFNGEIYNYREIKRDLEAKGVRFTTESDTEVVLESFRRYGPACLKHLRGMFAFAIWSTASRTVFIARDHFGIKPLYYYSKGDQFAFASELKTLTQVVPADLRISAPALNALLTYLWIPPGFCIFEEFRSLPPAHFMLVSPDGSFKIERYWTLDTSPITAPEPAIVDELCDALEDSVRCHMIADVEVGAFLSGGIDSSLLCALANRSAAGLRTFTIATDENAKKVERMSSDEMYARKMSQELGTNHSEILIGSNVIRQLSSMIDIVDEPIGDPAAINAYMMCVGARKVGVKVLLSGMGADEIFFGYRRQKAWIYAEHYRLVPGPLRRGIERVLSELPVRVGNRGLRSVRWAKKFMSFAAMDGKSRCRNSFSYYSKQALSELLEPEWRHGYDKIEDQFAGIFDQRYSDDPINRLCFVDLNLFLPGLNLAYTDRASMAASTEVRVPFVDTKIVQLAMRIPGALKFKRDESKHILKRAAERYLPREVIYRPKASFGVPLRAWIHGELRPMVDDLLSPARVKRRGWLSADACQKMIDSDRRGQNDFSYQIFQLLLLELWAQSRLDSGLRKAA